MHICVAVFCALQLEMANLTILIECVKIYIAVFEEAENPGLREKG